MKIIMNALRDAIFIPLVSTALYSAYTNPHLSPLEYKYTYGALLTFYATDFCFTKLNPDFIIHHSLAVYFIAHDFLYDIEPKFRAMILNVEIPSIVLTIVPYLPHRLQYPANLIFAGLFIHTRIVALYAYLTLDASLFSAAKWSFFALNLYWLGLIVRKVCKPFIGKKNLKDVMHFICSFTFATSFALHARHETIYEVAASGALAVASFKTHWNQIYDRYEKRWFVADIVSMHLVCITKQHCFSFSPFYTAVSWLFHTGVVAYRIYWIDDYTIPVSMAPMFLDALVTIPQFDHETKIAIITSGICMIVVEKIKPFYDLSFAFLHGLIIWVIHLYIIQGILKIRYLAL